MKRILCGVLILACLTLTQQTSAVPEVGKTCQRFVPVGLAENDRSGVPWHGFFALDTQTGQLCKTTSHSFDKPEYERLPSCYSLASSLPIASK
jgi:hypothetical protein